MVLVMKIVTIWTIVAMNITMTMVAMIITITILIMEIAALRKLIESLFKIMDTNAINL